MKKIKPKLCPFCARILAEDEAIVHVLFKNRQLDYVCIKCTHCSAQGPGCDTEEHAILAWNERNLYKEDE